MKKSFFALVLLLVTAVGCSSTRPTVLDDDAPPAPSTRVEEDATPAEPADEPGEPEELPTPTLRSAPDDWYQADAETDDLPGVGAKRAYETLLDGRTPARTVVVAVIDGGVDIEHEDLQGRLWVNEDEVPGNDVDDDANGYADDVHGWNFIGGADGQNVDHDTYELTRIYASLKATYAEANPDTLSGAAQAEYERYLEIREQWTTQRQELEQNLAQIENFENVYDQVTTFLKQHLGTDTLTVERLRAISSPDQRVQQARGLMLDLAAQDIGPQDIADQRTYFENMMRYGYDLSFDPRPVVGDDYADLDQRYYGNPDVAGPDAGHGTHVAGIIGAARGNDLGIDGIAADVQIMAVRAVPNGDERDKDVANAIRYAADNGAHIINMSFGKSYSPQKEAVDAAVRYADSLGVLLVHAAGNDGKDVDRKDNFPTGTYLDGGEAPSWISVGASSWNDDLAASFSNYGAESVDLFAPGVDIYSTVPDQKYERNSGTSMAAPVVTGVAALVMAYYPDLTAVQVKQVLMESVVSRRGVTVRRPGSEETVDFGALSRTGGIVNAYRALQQAALMSE